MSHHLLGIFFFFNETATTEIYTYVHTLSLHDALPIVATERQAAKLTRPPAWRSSRPPSSSSSHMVWTIAGGSSDRRMISSTGTGAGPRSASTACRSASFGSGAEGWPAA